MQKEVIIVGMKGYEYLHLSHAGLWSNIFKVDIFLHYHISIIR